MTYRILIVFLVSCVAVSLSCRKSSSLPKTSPTTDTMGIIGQWTWVRSDFLFTVLTPQSGIQKTLTFTDQGIVYVRHNDSAGSRLTLYVAIPPVRLANIVMDTLNYHFGPVSIGCPVESELNANFTALIAGASISQFKLSNDTLYLVGPPCLAQPDSVIYVRTGGANPL